MYDRDRLNIFLDHGNVKHLSPLSLVSLVLYSPFTCEFEIDLSQGAWLNIIVNPQIVIVNFLYLKYALLVEI